MFFIRNLPDQISNNPTMINLLHSVFLHTIPSSTSNDFDYCQFVDSSTRSNLLLTGSESLPPSCNPTNIDRETLINPAHFNCLYQFCGEIHIQWVKKLFTCFVFLHIFIGLSTPNGYTAMKNYH
jgi:hypothetical protein